MAISPSDFVINMTPNPTKAVLGMTGDINLSFSNTSATERGYNLSFSLTLPDGVSFASSTVIPTSITENMDNTITVEWLNLKDLAPNELNYQVGLTLQSDETFRATGNPVPFDVPLSSIVLEATVDTLPRGNDDPGNVIITKTDSINFIPLRYNISKSGPGKIPKGAGVLPATAPRWPYSYTIIVMNNTREPSMVTLVDNLANGIRYLDNLAVVGPDSAALSSPTVITPTPGPGCQDFVTIDWGSVTLSQGAVDEITFDAAVWDNYTSGCIENSGSRIPHMTPLQNIAVLDGASGPVEGVATTNAMDATINKSVSSNITDVGMINNYSLTYRINQYDNVTDFVITDLISDGQSYNSGSASITPDSVTVNPDGTTKLVWNLGLRTTGTTGTISFTTTTDANYSVGGPVSAGDPLNNNVNINGTNVNSSTATPDSSSASITIQIPTIDKELLNYYYKDGTVKPFNVAAPGDEVEFRLTYNATGIDASQLNVQIDEFAPPNMGPLSAALPVTYGGTVSGPFSPVTVSPNGLRWYLGNLPGNSLWTATFRIPVQNVVYVGPRNNLGKLATENTAGFAYSDRDQVEVLFGEPNIEFAKTVTGPDVNAIKAGETYTYTITISNPQNAEGTVVDAFEMDLTDVIPDGLTYAGSYNITGTGSYNPPVFSGQNVSMTITKLGPDESLSFNFDVTVDNDIVSGQTFTNNAVLQQPYSQPDRSFQYPGAPFTADTTLKAKAIIINKLINPTFAKIGDSVTYILQVTVPEGTTATNLQVVDNFPAATQSYISGSATKDGAPIIPDSVVGGTVSFPAIPFIDATTAAVNITYSFDVRIIDAIKTSPYVDRQTDSVTVNWYIDGTPAVPVTAEAILEVRVPHLIGNKGQRNVTKGGPFTTQNVNYDVGDIIEYRITLTNNGKAPAYNTVFSDTINPLLTFNPGSITTTTGSASESGGVITWDIPFIDVNGIVTITFQVTTDVGVASDVLIPDSGSFSYDSNNNGFEITFGPTNTNTVRINSPRLTINKNASILVGEIGDDITYTIDVTVPNGTIAYNVTLNDTLPTGQTYFDNATVEIPPNPPGPATPTVSGQNIEFDPISDVDASSGAITITYSFVARITSATHQPTYTETQTNSSTVEWAVTSGGTPSRSASDNLDITAKTPNITVLKEQRNSTTGGSFTTDDITGLPGNDIRYQFTVTSNGASPAYNIDLTDILSNNLVFNGIIAVSAGTVTPPAVSPGGTLTWNISQLNAGNTATLEISVTINTGSGAGSVISDQLTGTYDSNDVNPIQYNAESNIVKLNIPSLELDKTVSTSVAAIGNTITYTLTITVPNGTAAYNLEIRDMIPSQQQYVSGSWTPGVGTPGVGTPGGTLTQINHELIYNNLSTNPVIGPATLVYTFATTVEAGPLTPPYTAVQTNYAEIIWDLTAGGPQAVPVTDSVDVEIKTPHIFATKEQRNDTTGGSFTTTPLTGVAIGDIIQYRIILTNDGANTAYNVITEDDLANELTYQGVVAPAPPGTVTSSVPSGNPNGTITWTETSLASGDSVTLVFAVKVNADYAPGQVVFDQTSTVYDTALTNPTILGPVYSNQVAFEYNLPVITKSVDKQNVFVGDTVEYTVEITIPEGSIAYNVQVTDSLPANQSYVSDSLTRNGIPITPSPTLTFPNEGTIDATAGAVTITYTFEATVDSISSSPQETQTDTATINWDITPGNPGVPQDATANVNVTDSSITLEKAQRNFTASGPGPFTTDTIPASLGDIIYYQLTVTNPSANTIYNVLISDKLSDLLGYVGQVVAPPVGLISHTGDSSNGTVTWSIPLLNPSDSYNAVIAVQVLPGGGTASLINNDSSVVFTAVSGSGKPVYGPIDSNEVSLQLPALEVNKSTSKDEWSIGELIEYSIDVVVPARTIAYNVVLQDTLPLQQTYVGMAFIDGIEVFPTVIGQEITFDPIMIDATAGEKIVNYSFQARIVSGNMSSPYTETQTDNVTIYYDINEQGEPAEPVSDSKTITVKSPFVFIAKDQRNVTENSGFVVTEIPVEKGDIVEFRIIAHNFGAAPAYNVVITDDLGPYLAFDSVVSVSAGIVNYDSINNKLTWTIDTLSVFIVEVLDFTVKVIGGVGAGGTGSNQAEGFYDTYLVNPITVGPFESNEVLQRYPNVEINKTANLLNATIGDIITYQVTFTLPAGTVAYNGQFIDMLPIGQQYNNNATLNGNAVIPVEIVEQMVKFPVLPFGDATAEAKNFVYQFDVLVTSANITPPDIVTIQTNEAEGLWYIDPQTPAPTVNDRLDIQVTDSNMTITKEQRNKTREQTFTIEAIVGIYNDIIEYKLTVTNTGPRAIYDVNISDPLSSSLEYVGVVNVTGGTVNHSGGSSNGTITWNIPQLDIGITMTLIFSLKILTKEEEQISNMANGDFKLDPQATERFGNKKSNITILNVHKRPGRGIPLTIFNDKF